ncbi:hypothetical protein GCM10022220_04390 [Actinocatenispora rupis]|uniref:Uncharacterized protein n=1 Tax=Actinocatenispora rupis TaxID=519421 RepID=A0A8J3J5D4_9ACTN|nr:hypothetical protein Aru02nite_59340 [Actinocatenispora rupis]
MSGRNAHRISGSQYHAVTVVGVNVRCPAISVIASSTGAGRSLYLGFGGAFTRAGAAPFLVRPGAAAASPRLPALPARFAGRDAGRCGAR